MSFFLVGCFWKKSQEVTENTPTSDNQEQEQATASPTEVNSEAPDESESIDSNSAPESTGDTETTTSDSGISTDNTVDTPLQWDTTQDETITETPEELVEDFDAEIESLFDLFEEDE